MSDDEGDAECSDYEEQICFVGCTCKHDPGEHGWGHCNIDDCPCSGGWEE